ncbi:fructokinase [Deinococcus aerius]|uniref:Fructokinase n=2 Tax=Deinococcus aerius TaxID=200253 RepID=A0A2I9CTF2_9DEIO|nr:fructokinase [Deinococcus aerius]
MHPGAGSGNLGGMTVQMPLIVSAGEALTDLVTAGGNVWHAHPGGAAWNVARACARLGVPSAFAGAVGQDNFGEDLRRAGGEAGLDPRFLQQVPAPTLMAVVYQLDPPAYRFLGENSADLHFDPARLPQGWEGAARWLHVGGISLARWPLADTLLGMIGTARGAGVKVSFDPNARITHRHPDYPAVFERVIRQADLLKFSDEDLSFFFPGLSEEDALRRVRGLNARCPIVVTRGAQGATLYQPAGRADLPTVPVAVADTVGAGDALCAGLLVSATERPDARWTEHLQLGLRAAAAACARPGAYAPTRADLEALGGGRPGLGGSGESG